MLSEKKLRQELEEARNELKKLQNYTKTLKKKTNEDEVNRFHLKTKQEKKTFRFSRCFNSESSQTTFVSRHNSRS